MKRRKDSGFAMLAVFLMAACVAITLYIEVPRVAFEAERQRELLLVDRGNQFKRAIQVFVKDRVNNPTGRYPASIDEMESFNNHRYLRRRYLDPMTGKDEWRLVHINGGILTDSVTTQAKPGGNQSISTTSNYLSQQTFLDAPAEGNGGAGGATRALNRRPSDTAGAPGDPNNPGGAPGTTGDINGGLPGVPGANPSGIPPGLPGQPGAPGSPTAGQQTGQQTSQQPCQVYIGSCPPTTTASGQQAQGVNGGLPPGMQPGIPGGSGFGTPGGSGFGTPGAPGGAQGNAQSAAAQMIGNLLTTPRPGGMPSGMPGTTIGGGIAGVASKYEAEGIMVINQRTKINEWEYIFDATKWRAPPNPVSGTVGTPLQPGMNGPGISPTGPGTTPGGSTGTGTGTGPGGAVINH